MKLKKTLDFPLNKIGELSGNTPYPAGKRMLEEEVTINFPDGVPAFENSKRFILMINEKIAPFLYLKSLDVKDLGFICVDPFSIRPDYVVNLSLKHRSILKIKDPKFALVLSFVTVDKDPRNTTANLLAPVVINVKELLGCQVIQEKYPVRHNIWSSLPKTQTEKNKGEDGPCSC